MSEGAPTNGIDGYLPDNSHSANKGKKLLEMSSEQLAYLAGLFDGEGHIAIHRSKGKPGGAKHYYCLRVTLAMSHFPIIERMQELSGLGSLMVSKLVPKAGSDKTPNRPMVSWRITSRQAEQLLTALLPYLKVKREEAELALEFSRYSLKLGVAVGAAMPPNHWALLEGFKQAMTDLKSKLPKPTSKYLLQKLEERYKEFGCEPLDYIVRGSGDE